jgi:hypothetical protein
MDEEEKAALALDETAAQAALDEWQVRHDLQSVPFDHFS